MKSPYSKCVQQLVIVPFVSEEAHSIDSCMQEQVNQSTSLQMSTYDEETPSTEPCIPEQINQNPYIYLYLMKIYQKK